MAVLWSATIFLSAFLLFLVQPMMAKMILPMLGGTPAVWNTCMLFYQATLLAGYAYVHLMTSRLEPLLGPRQGTWVLVGLGAMMLVGLLPTIGWLRRYRYTWAALAIALQLLTLAFGRDPNGSGARYGNGGR